MEKHQTVSISPKITEARRSRTTFSNAGRRYINSELCILKNILQERIKNKENLQQADRSFKNSHRKLSTEKRKDNQRSVEPSQKKETHHNE